MRGANNVRIWTKERSFVCRRTLELKVLSVCFLWAPGGQMSGYLASMSRWKPEHRIGPHLGEISDFNREVDENCALLGCYSSSGVQKRILDPWKMGPICCPETSVRNYHYSLRNNLEERSSDRERLQLVSAAGRTESFTSSSLFQARQTKHLADRRTDPNRTEPSRAEPAAIKANHRLVMPIWPVVRPKLLFADRH